MPTGDQSDAVTVIMQKSDAYRIMAALQAWSERHTEAAKLANDHATRADHERHAERADRLARLLAARLGH
jgi:hypothetical protein